MAQLNAYTAIYDKLAGSGASFYTSLGSSGAVSGSRALYLVQAPTQETAYPACIITPVSDVPDKYLNSSADDINFEFQIDLYGDALDSTPEALITINDLLVTLLDEAALTMTDHGNAQTQLRDRGVVTREDDTYRITSQWRLIATVTA